MENMRHGCEKCGTKYADVRREGRSLCARCAGFVTVGFGIIDGKLKPFVKVEGEWRQIKVIAESSE